MIMITTTTLRLIIRQALKLGTTVSCGAVPGTMLVDSCVPLIAPGSLQVMPGTTSVFGVPVAQHLRREARPDKEEISDAFRK